MQERAGSTPGPETPAGNPPAARVPVGKRMERVTGKRLETWNDGRDRVFTCTIQVVDGTEEGDVVVGQEVFSVFLDTLPGVTTALLQERIDQRKRELRNRADNVAQIDLNTIT